MYYNYVNYLASNEEAQLPGWARGGAHLKEVQYMYVWPHHNYYNSKFCSTYIN